MGKLKADGLDPIWDFKTKNMLLALYLKFLIPTDFFFLVLQAGALDLLKELKNIPMTLELLQVQLLLFLCCKN